MLTVVCFKWKPQHDAARFQFGPEHVHTLRSMVARNYKQPHRFVCVTDDTRGIESIETVPLWDTFASVPSPHGGQNPSCYRRLVAFGPEGERLFGKRFVAVDLDAVIVGDMRPIWDRPQDFVIWGETDPRSWYNGSMWLMTANARRQVLDRFDPKTSPAEAKKAGRFGSDQGWISYCLGPGEATWTREDGVYSHRVHIAPKGNTLPKNAKIVFFHGRVKPWSYEAMNVPWIEEHYRA